MRDSDAWLAKLMVADELLGGWVDGLQGKGVNRVLARACKCAVLLVQLRLLKPLHCRRTFIPTAAAVPQLCASWRCARRTQMRTLSG